MFWQEFFVFDYEIIEIAKYRIIHAYGRHIYKEDGTRLALVWYTDQGAFVDDGKNEKDRLLNSMKNQLAERSIGIKTGHDYLTGLPSMTYFFELADAGCERIRKSGKTPVILFTDFEIFDEPTALHFIEDDKKALSMDRPYIFYEDVPDAAGNPRQFQTTKLKFMDDTGRECLLGLCQQ